MKIMSHHFYVFRLFYIFGNFSSKDLWNGNFILNLIYLGNISFEGWVNNDMKFIIYVMVDSKKMAIRKWLKLKSPSIDKWMHILNIYIMEILFSSDVLN